MQESLRGFGQTVLFLLPHSVAVSLPCLLYSMPSVNASTEPNSTEQRPQKQHIHSNTQVLCTCHGCQESLQRCTGVTIDNWHRAKCSYQQQYTVQVICQFCAYVICNRMASGESVTGMQIMTLDWQITQNKSPVPTASHSQWDPPQSPPNSSLH